MPVPQNNPHNEIAVCMPIMADVSVAGSVFAPSPVRGTLVRGYSCLGGAITGADCTWTVKINGVAVTGTGTITASGSAAGDVDEVVRFTGPNVGVNQGDKLEVVSGGESSTTATAQFVLVIRN